MSKKYRYEAASDSGAAFLFSLYNPVMKVAIREFRTHQEMDAYQTESYTTQVRRHLPILLEVLEVDTDNEKLILGNLNRMAVWYFHTIMKTI